MSKFRMFLMVTALFTIGSLAMAATVTVTAGDAADLKAQVTSVDTWGSDAEADVVVVPAGTYVFTTAILNNGGENPRIRFPHANMNSINVTVKKADGAASPILVLSETTRALFYMDGGTRTFDGLTIIGAADSNITMSEGVFCVEADGDPIGGVRPESTVTIRNCLITANNGSNAPVTAFSGSVPSTGLVARAVTIGDDPDRNGQTVVIENCTFAFTTGEAVNVGGRAPADEIGPFRHVTVSHTMMAGCGMGLQVKFPTSSSALAKPEITLDGCLIVNWTSRGVNIQGTDSSNADPIVTVNRTIIGPTGNGIPVNYNATAAKNAVDLRVTRSTIHRGGADCLEPDADPVAPSGIKITMTDVVAGPHEGFDSWLRDNNVELAGYTVARLGGKAKREEGGVDIVVNGLRPDKVTATAEAAFAALYDGSGPLIADPMFVNSTFGSSFDGQIGWDSADNDLLDIGSGAYTWKGKYGEQLHNALTGGAELDPSVPVELSTFQVE